MRKRYFWQIITGLAGKTPIEEAKVDAIADLAKDFNAEISDYLPIAGGLRPGNKVEYNMAIIFLKFKHISRKSCINPK